MQGGLLAEMSHRLTLSDDLYASPSYVLIVESEKVVEWLYCIKTFLS